ncbi:MAG TPA: M23 family metallopeptidase [Flavihumibacter sp.]
MFRLTLIGILIASMAQAQYSGLPDYPRGYFRNPLGIPISLSGNFGELRPNHYHMGLDLKTERRENLSVYAAADGYVSRIKVEPFGFGRAIYVTHPNGYTTVYCHLNSFFPELENWVKALQYKKESWALNDEVPTDLFPVKKGQLLAYSGNTGGSQAPHLHFEIRRTSDEVNLNPQLFGLPIPDNTLPSILRVAIYDRTRSVYEQSPKMVAVTSKGNGQYSAPVQTVNTPKISLALTTYDTHTGSTNLNGVFEAVLYNAKQPVVGFRMDEISYDATRYLNAHIDYKTKQGGGPYLQHLSELPGYISSIYTKFSGDGVIDLSDGELHELSIVVRDANGNASTVTVPVKYSGKASAPVTPPGKRFYPLMVDIYESEDCEFIIGERTLYDSVSILHRKQPGSGAGVVSDIHTIGSVSIPLQDAIPVRIRLRDTVSEQDRARIVMQRTAGTKKEVQKVTWDDDWAMASFRDFGSFQLVVDNTPPEISPIGFQPGANLSAASRISFTVTDNLGKWRVVRTELDGKWIRFTNDKGKVFIYQFDEHCKPGDHELRILAMDEAGNEKEVRWKFRR